MELNLIKKINEKLIKGSSMSQVEKDLGYGKDTLRKKLRREGYSFNRNTKQYEIIGNTNNTPSVITHDNQEVTNKEIKEVIKVTHDELSQEDIITLKEIIKKYQEREKQKEYELDGKIITRSFRTYKNVIDKFTEHCKENNLSQKDSIAIALIRFMES